MTIRLPVNTSYINFRDGQAVTQKDLITEQNHNIQTDSAIINNFFGSGILLEAPVRKVIFNSDELTTEQDLYVTSNDFDGRGIKPHNQPTDLILGNQLEITLSNANVSFRRSIKVCIIGTDFQNNLQYETFQFNTNEIQVSKKHFKTVISFLFVDFKGNKNGSLTSGGTIVIQEAAAMEISRDEIMTAQNLEPNLFFRDFKPYIQLQAVAQSVILSTVLQEALFTSGFTVDALNINMNYVDKKQLSSNNITKRVGQKFKANSNNIQKVRILLGAELDSSQTDDAKWFDWSGDLIVSIHALQTTISCPSDNIPTNAIDYQPKPTPLAQIVVTQATLKENGIYLTNIAQPIDFIFTNTKIGNNSNSSNNSGIVKNNYYAITIQRAGDSSVGAIFTETGRSYLANSIYTEFDGSNWIDNSTEDLWFEIYTDSIKIASGYGYDNGNGFAIEKTKIDEDGNTVDYCYDGVHITNGNGAANYAIVQAVTDLKTIVQSDITGDDNYSQKQSVAEISVLSTAQLTSLLSVGEPIVLGCAYDANTKSSVILNKSQSYIGLANGNIFTIINPDSDLLAYNLVGGKLNPNINNSSAKQYIIYKSTLVTNGYGDIDGDGIISLQDIAKANGWLGKTLSDATTQSYMLITDENDNNKISMIEFLRADVDGDGVITSTDIEYITKLYNKENVLLPKGSSFKSLNLFVENLIGRTDGYFSSFDGYARLWDSPYPRIAQYNIDSALKNSNTLPYYGYPVPVNIAVNEAALKTTPFVSVNYRITITPTWTKELLKTHVTTKYIPCTFSYTDKTTTYDIVEPVKTSSIELTKNVSMISNVGGRNDMYIPDNLVIGKGQLLKQDGNYFPIDLEVGTVSLTLPARDIADKSLNIFTTFVAESTAQDGFTAGGYKAMRFADNSFVQLNAIQKQQLRFHISIESLAQNVDGQDPNIIEGYGPISDPLPGTYINHETGVLTIRGTNLNNGTAPTNSCKLNISVFIKKAGWSNSHVRVSSEESTALLFGTVSQSSPK